MPPSDKLRIMRHPLYASVLLALVATPAVLAQSAAQVPTQPYSSSLDPEIAGNSLPDAPSTVLQQSQAPVAAPAPQNETADEKKARERREEGEREVQAQEKQRVGGVLPLFNVVIAGQTVPLTPKEKFNISLHTIVDPYTFALAVVFGGGLGELEDSHTGYGHGPSGLFKRIGASYADNAIGNVIGNAALPSLLHQDPRYYRKGTGTVKSRIIYSALTTFICYGDNGKRQFNISNVGGNFISGAISNAYYPSNERGVGLTIENGLLVTAEGMLGAQLLEFSPDYSAYMQRRHQRKLDAQKAAADAAAAARANQPPPRTRPDPTPPGADVPKP